VISDTGQSDFAIEPRGKRKEYKCQIGAFQEITRKIGIPPK
jgi:hypothetical protein